MSKETSKQIEIPHLSSTLTVKVVDQDGRPVPGALVTWVKETNGVGEELTATTDENGDSGPWRGSVRIDPPNGRFNAKVDDARGIVAFRQHPEGQWVMALDWNTLQTDAVAWQESAEDFKRKCRALEAENKRLRDKLALVDAKMDENAQLISENSKLTCRLIAAEAELAECRKALDGLLTIIKTIVGEGQILGTMALEGWIKIAEKALRGEGE